MNTPPITCPQCSKVVTRKQWNARLGVFCSDFCKSAWTLQHDPQSIWKGVPSSTKQSESKRYHGGYDERY